MYVIKVVNPISCHIYGYGNNPVKRRYDPVVLVAIQTQVSSSDCMFFVFCLSVNLSYFHLFQNHLVLTKPGTWHLWVKAIQVYSNEGSRKNDNIRNSAYYHASICTIY